MNASPSLERFRNVRSGSHRLVEALDADILQTIPPDVSNNILWYFGHVVIDGCEMLRQAHQSSPVRGEDFMHTRNATR